MSKAKHTPGPWRWEFNELHRSLHLVGGLKRYDLTVIDFDRWGMNGATMRLRDPEHDGMNIMHKVHERQDWIAPEPGREHHKDWHQFLTHPDALLIQAAPDLLDAMRDAVSTQPADSPTKWVLRARAAIAKATGEPRGN